MNPLYSKLDPCPPTLLPFSSTVTFWPFWLRKYPSASPEMPAPMTRKCLLMFSREDKRLAEPVRHLPMADPEHVDHSLADRMEEPGIGFHPEDEVSEAELLEMGLDEHHIVAAFFQHQGDGAPREIIEVHTKEEDPSASHHLGEQASHIRVIHHQHPARLEGAVAFGEGFLRVRHVLKDIPKAHGVKMIGGVFLFK